MVDISLPYFCVPPGCPAGLPGRLDAPGQPTGGLPGCPAG